MQISKKTSYCFGLEVIHAEVKTWNYLVYNSVNPRALKHKQYYPLSLLLAKFQLFDHNNLENPGS